MCVFRCKGCKLKEMLYNFSNFIKIRWSYFISPSDENKEASAMAQALLDGENEPKLRNFQHPAESDAEPDTIPGVMKDTAPEAAPEATDDCAKCANTCGLLQSLLDSMRIK